MIKIKGKEVTYHLAFWFLYLIIWSTRDLVYYQYFFRNLTINTWQTLLIIPFIYLNLYLLIPRFLFKGSYTIYFITTAIVLVLSTFYSSFFNNIIFQNIYQFEDTASYYISPNGLLVIFTEIVVVNFSAMSFFLFRTWFKQELRLRVIEKEKVESELKMLKLQIQPHFIFNTLNTIYLFMEKNSNEAKETLLGFSELLSHQLYEVQNDFVDLKKEIHYLRKYFEIEQLRYSDTLNLKFTIDIGSEKYKIAPLLLIPFIENAFKHGKQVDDYWVDFSLRVEEGMLRMKVENPYSPLPSGDKRSVDGGIGLENVKKRLKLIYGDKHNLNIIKGEKKYKVDLELILIES